MEGASSSKTQRQEGFSTLRLEENLVQKRHLGAPGANLTLWGATERVRGKDVVAQSFGSLLRGWERQEGSWWDWKKSHTLGRLRK